jgi:hypothetical protein
MLSRLFVDAHRCADLKNSLIRYVSQISNLRIRESQINISQNTKFTCVSPPAGDWTYQVVHLILKICPLYDYTDLVWRSIQPHIDSLCS